MTFDARQEAIEVVGETEFFIFDLGIAVEHYTTARLPVTTNVFTGSTETYLPLPVRRVGLTKKHTTQPDTTKLVMPVKPSFISLISQAGLDKIGITIVRGFGTNYAVDYQNPWWNGFLVDVTVGINIMEGNLHTSEALFKDVFPKIFHQSGCNNALYDSVCGVNPASFTITRTVTDIQEGGRIVLFDGAIPTNDFYTQGWIKRPADLPWRNIRQQAGSQLVLHVPILGLAIGDTVDIRAGCLKRIIEDCTDKFGNKPKSVAMPLVPQQNPVIDGF